MPIVFCDREKLQEKPQHEHWPTDPDTAKAAVLAYLDYAREEQMLFPRLVFDPGAGSGVWGQTIVRESTVRWLVGCDIREDLPKPAHFNEWLPGTDFLEHDLRYTQWGKPYDLFLGNPPFSQAEAFVRHALSGLREDGHVLFLLRTAFLESAKRRDSLFTELPPRRIFICSRRPKFRGPGRALDCYSVFLWEKGYRGRPDIDWLR